MTVEDDGAWAHQLELEHQEWLQTIVCTYCYEPKNDKTSCCDENHFCKVLELDK